MSLSSSQTYTLHRYLWFFILLAIIAYWSPWLINQGAGLSLGAYDLAEWASLHPAVRAGSPVLLTSLLLRLPLVCLALSASLTAENTLKNRGWYLRASLCLGIVVALLPPLEYLAHPVGDANYGQQLTLSIIALAGGVVGLNGRLRGLTPSLYVLCPLLGGITTIVGVLQAHDLMRQFNLPAQIGAGALVLALIYGLIALINYPRRPL